MLDAFNDAGLTVAHLFDLGVDELPTLGPARLNLDTIGVNRWIEVKAGRARPSEFQQNFSNVSVRVSARVNPSEISKDVAFEGIEWAIVNRNKIPRRLSDAARIQMVDSILNQYE